MVNYFCGCCMTEQRCNDFLQSPLGLIEVMASNQAVTNISVVSVRGVAKANPITDHCLIQLQEYFLGKRSTFDLPLNGSGTPFQQLVWNAVGRIAYGETKSYQEIAVEIGNHKAQRAVGFANHRNPLPIVIPCHRVVGKDATLTGYAYGLEAKRWLLMHEKDYRVHADKAIYAN